MVMESAVLPRDTLFSRLKRLHWGLIAIIFLIVLVGTGLLYGAGAPGGSWEPYAEKHLTRFVAGLGVAILIAVIDLRHIYRISYGVYFLAIILLALVPVIGVTAMGATRWLDFGILRIQPSELAKIGIILALAKYYHTRPLASVSTIPGIAIALVMILLPVGLTFIQPDLGTALMLCMVGAGLMFACGVSWKFFALGIAGATSMLPVAWHFLKDYQKQRVLTFLDPENDPLGAGYHILQSKIAIGSAGFWGKGYMEGSQSHLLFLPEKHTDFIFTLLTEDFGMAGALVLMALYLTLILTNIGIAVRSRHQYGTALVLGVTLTIFLYAFINMAMVMGLMPVVGVPLPFVSFGGTALLTLMVSIGLVMNIHVHRNSNLPGAAGLKGSRSF